ncbi:uncharacterized protein DUF3567 [Azonexus fungiphilus]|jgi:hypothetical protein|uniref:Uncharacterized protein DUF3567 n=1 Tax=Azonexus fungiphilus TaxID=146940 RepID=A0A495VJN0_9RHOO|nr:DUF3567 family protein [Azonexus fungiphilus]NHC07730.1 DUF3567 family protein [Azonexus fungiphilus]RKT49569.1 uncharacterized protein DUF3567 [Azonexus fungiphilus]
MNLVYNSEHFTVVAYPAWQGFELVDKENGRMLFLHGAEASCFRAAIDGIPEATRDVETIDAFLDDYCAGTAQPIVLH